MSNPEPSIRVTVDPMNPGQFFACCGLLELADRLWKEAEGWFENAAFCLRPTSTVEDATGTGLFCHLAKCQLTNTMTSEQEKRLKELSAEKGSVRAKTPGLDQEKKAHRKAPPRRTDPLG